MIGASYEMVVRCWITPRDLREIADEMEEKFKTVMPGDDLTIKEWYGKGVNIMFVIDQERM